MNTQKKRELGAYDLCENYSHTYPSLAKEQTQLSDKKLCAA